MMTMATAARPARVRRAVVVTWGLSHEVSSPRGVHLPDAGGVESAGHGSLRR